jgi:hypothetical protein
MLVTFKDGYVENYAVIGDLPGGTFVEFPEDEMETFEVFHRSYKISEDGSLVLDMKKVESNQQEEIRNDLRYERELVCFPVINRGKLWYDSLTPEELDELEAWYQAWLDAPQTGIVPNTPSWLEVR